MHDRSARHLTAALADPADSASSTSSADPAAVVSGTGTGPRDDDALDRAAAAAPLLAVRSLVLELGRVPGAGPQGPWEVLVAALQVRAAELARASSATWRLAVGSAVPLQHWTAGAWAADVRAALLAGGFSPRAADQAVDVVAVDLQRTCPVQTVLEEPGAPEEPGPLEGYPVLDRLRLRLSADAPASPSADGLVARVAALRT